MPLPLEPTNELSPQHLQVTERATTPNTRFPCAARWSVLTEHRPSDLSFTRRHGFEPHPGGSTYVVNVSSRAMCGSESSGVSHPSSTITELLLSGCTLVRPFSGSGVVVALASSWTDYRTVRVGYYNLSYCQNWGFGDAVCLWLLVYIAQGNNSCSRRSSDATTHKTEVGKSTTYAPSQL